MESGKKQRNNKKEQLIQYIMKINSEMLAFKGFVILGSLLLLGFVVFCLFFLV